MKPILFNTKMVRAILDGRKTVTRRVVVDINPDVTCHHGQEHEFVWDNFTGGEATGFVCRECGYGVSPPYDRYPVGTSFFRPRYNPGDILYVPEAWKCSGTFGEFGYEVEFRDGQHIKFKFEDQDRAKKWGKYRDRPSHQWQSPYFMPREAARLFLRVTDIRVERLQDITEEQARAEGASPLMITTDVDKPDSEKKWHEMLPALPGFIGLWDSTIKKDDLPHYGWSANPWVWVIEFKKLERADKP